ncbi:MAG: hypothetical protein DRH33_07445, partial [Candidatus Nealsonbacteria bacterium]
MKRTTYETRLNILICLFILFIIFIFSSQTVIAEPNTNLNLLLYSEDKEDTSTHLKLYVSDEITPNKRIIYSIVITASVPSPLGQGNVIDQGLTALVVPEDAEVDYQNIKVYGAPTPDSNKYVEYQPESELTKEWFNILGSIVSKIPFLGLVMDLAPIYQAKPGDYGEFINLNQYDIVKVNWEAPRLKCWQKVQIDIPVHLDDDTGIGLYAYWQSRASSSDGTGPTFARDNMIDIGFSISEKQLEEEVVSRVEKLTWDKTFGGSDDDYLRSLIQTDDGGYAVAGYTSSKGAGEDDTWVIKLDMKGNIVWDKTFGGSGDDKAGSIIQTTDGGYAIAGETESQGNGEADAWILKLNSQGNILWDKTFGGSGMDGAYSLIQTTDGGYAVAGRTESKGAGEYDAWLIKLDGQGNILWEKTYGGSGDDEVYSITQTTEGGYVIAGSNSEKFPEKADAWLIKLDGQGNILWEKTYGGSDYDNIISILQHTDGSYMTIGTTSSKGAGSYDIWIIKLDHEGYIVWDRTFGRRKIDSAGSIIQTTDGGYALAGTTWYKMDAVNWDVWIIKLDNEGNILWDKTFGGSGMDGAYSLIQT